MGRAKGGMAQHEAGLVDAVDIIQHRGLAEKTYLAIKARILDGRFAPDHRLRVDALARLFGVSHTPVKLALQRLLAEGLVRQVPRRGIFVNALGARDIEELHEIRFLIELAAAERGLALVTEDDLQRLRAVLAEAEAALQGGAAEDKALNARLNHAFHRVMIELAGNRRLVEMYDRLIWEEYAARLTRIRPLLPLEQSIAEHRQLLQAYERRDLPGLLAVLREHLDHIREMALRGLAAATETPVSAGAAREALR